MTNKGFTLIELLVVITIIVILTGIASLNFSGAQTRARSGRAEADLQTIKSAMRLYRVDVGQLPPWGDSCSACWGNNNGMVQSAWNVVMNSLISDDGQAGWAGPYLDETIDTDPWGLAWMYDDNDQVCWGYESSLCSKGPNKLWNGRGGDDICVIVLRDNVESC